MSAFRFYPKPDALRSASVSSGIARRPSVTEGDGWSIGSGTALPSRTSCSSVRVQGRVPRHGCCFSGGYWVSGTLFGETIASCTAGVPDGWGGLDADQRRLGNELSIAHIRYRLEERPDHEWYSHRRGTSFDAPPSVSTESWVRSGLPLGVSAP